MADRPSRPARTVARSFERADAQRTGREQVIYSSRWRTPLLVDLALGTVVVVVGVVLAVSWSPIVGGGIGAVGGVYGALAVRRWRLWVGLRRAAAETASDH